MDDGKHLHAPEPESLQGRVSFTEVSPQTILRLNDYRVKLSSTGTNQEALVSIPTLIAPTDLPICVDMVWVNLAPKPRRGFMAKRDLIVDRRRALEARGVSCIDCRFQCSPSRGRVD
jgi:hypothetical protein